MIEYDWGIYKTPSFCPHHWKNVGRKTTQREKGKKKASGPGGILNEKWEMSDI